jgi:hypothetical protein
MLLRQEISLRCYVLMGQRVILFRWQDLDGFLSWRQRRENLLSGDVLNGFLSIIIIIMSLVTVLFSLVLLLFNQLWYPSLRLQISHCRTFRILCDVSSTAVFCSESIKCFPGRTSKFFFKSVAPVINGMIIRFMLHICCTSVHKPVYLF